jgi:cobalt-zinc-cadmium efflux system membrane fusion protein
MAPGCGCGNRTEDHSEEHHEENAVHLKEESQKLIGLQLVKAEKKSLQTMIEVVGEIAQETESVAHVTCPQPGVLKSFLRQLGEVVEKDTPLCVVETKTGEKLEIVSPTHGIVLAQYVKEGDSVDNLTSIMTVADPDILRASFNVYEKDLAGIELGQKVKVESVAYPDKDFEGEIVFISPSVDEKTRTIKIRVNVKNDEHLLKFGMFVTGTIVVPLSEEVLTIPHEAVQEVKEKTVAFVPKEGEAEEFLLKEIKTGREVSNAVEVVEGLNEGREVVGKGSFYLKSELLKSELEEGHAH